MTFKIVARTQAASEAVSLLNFEPKVSKFYLKQSTKKRQKDTTYAII